MLRGAEGALQDQDVAGAARKSDPDPDAKLAAGNETAPWQRAI